VEIFEDDRDGAADGHADAGEERADEDQRRREEQRREESDAPEPLQPFIPLQRRERRLQHSVVRRRSWDM
jgi:hypothetical protein